MGVMGTVHMGGMETNICTEKRAEIGTVEHKELIASIDELA